MIVRRARSWASGDRSGITTVLSIQSVQVVVVHQTAGGLGDRS
jgi:hypothetical protein